MNTIRTAETGGSRDTSKDKLEYARFLSPEVLEMYATYMHKHRLMKDGTLREPDNWKCGMPRQWYMDGMYRHMHDLWMIHETGKAVRPETGEEVTITEALCAIIFNAMGYLYEVIRGRSV